MEVFHYTTFDRWRSILASHSLGLEPHYMTHHWIPEVRGWKVSFAHLSPMPTEWSQSEHFPDMWNLILKHTGRFLLSVDIDPKKDKTFVVDSGHMAGFRDSKRQNLLPSKYRHGSILAADRAYYQSKIPLLEYLDYKKELDYSLPEVAIPKVVPKRKISVHPEQIMLWELFKESDNQEIMHTCCDADITLPVAQRLVEDAIRQSQRDDNLVLNYISVLKKLCGR